MNGHYSLAVSISREEFSNLKRIEKKIENNSVKPIIGEGYEINYTQVLFVGLCWLCASFCETEWRLLDVWYLTLTEKKSWDSCKDDIASSFNISIITGYVAQAFEELCSDPRGNSDPGEYGGPQGSNTLKLENTFHPTKTHFTSLKQIVFDLGKYNSNFKNTIQTSKTQFTFENTFQISKTQFKLQKHIWNFKNTIQLSKTHFKS